MTRLVGIFWECKQNNILECQVFWHVVYTQELVGTRVQIEIKL